MSDLESLIAKADEETRSRKQPGESSRSKAKPSATKKPTLAAWVVMGLILAFSLFFIGQTFIPVSQKAIRSDLEAALEAAHDTIEEYRRVNGRLPEHVPVTALASLVRFEPSNDGYRLTSSINGITLSRDY